ncbi:MAG: hypothetical protein AB7T63_05205 [Planctomycetota bacterium]
MHRIPRTADRRGRWASVPLAFLLLLVPWTSGRFAPTSVAEEPAQLSALSDSVDARAYPWVAPAVARLDAELDTVAERASGEDPSISLVTWAAYGSGFLRHVTRGRDLDCMAVFDLGTVPVDEAAERALGRIEVVLRALIARTHEEPRDPGLAPWKVEGADAEGQIENREQGLEMLRGTLAARTHRPISVRLERGDGVGQATVMAPGEVPLPAMPDAAYLSNAVRYREGMPTAIRQVSVMLYFVVQVEHADGARRRWILTPALTWLGLPIPFEPLAFFLSFPDRSARERYAQLLDRSHDFLETRQWLAADLLRTGRAQYDRGSATKTLKRMHQALDVLGAALEPSVRARLERDLAAWLDAPSARELSDLEKVATIMKEVARVPALHALYVASGTVEAIRAHWTQALAAMASQVPDHAQALGDLAAELARLADVGEQADPEAWAAVSEQAAALSTATGPDVAAVERALALLEAPLLRAGWRFVPVVGAEGLRIQVAAKHLREARVHAPALRAARYGDFTFDVVESDAEPIFYLPLRLKREPAERRALAELRCRLACVDARFRSRLGGARTR